MNTATEITTALATVAAAEKFDAVYLNTPWNKLSLDELKALPLGALTKDDASLFMWADTFTVGQATALLSEWGYTFHSVHSIVDFAEKLAAVPVVDPVATPPIAEPVAAEGDGPTPMDVNQEEQTDGEGAAASATAEQTDGEEGVVQEEAAADGTVQPAPKKASKPRGPRVKTIQPFPWWPAESVGNLVRPCSEQLWMAVRGSGAAIKPKYKVEAFQVQQMPDAAKAKSRSRQPAAWCPAEWFMTRPGSHLEAIKAALAPEARIVELFGDAVYPGVYAFGPGVPGGYIPALDVDASTVAVNTEALSAYGKVALKALASKLRRGDLESEPVQKLLNDVATAASAHGIAAVSGLDWTAKPLPQDLMRIASFIVDNQLQHLSTHKSKRAPRGKFDSEGNPYPRFGFARAGPISPEIADLIGEPLGNELAWTTVIARVNDYIKQNQLQQGASIVPDAKLRALLRMEEGETVRNFDLGKKLKVHYISNKRPREDGEEEEQKTAQDDESSSGGSDEEAKKARVEAAGL